MPLPRFFAPDAAPGRVLISLSDDEAHHLRHVLRLADGAEVIVFDGVGHEWRARVADVNKSSVQVAIEEPATPVAEPLVKITLGIGVLKGDQMNAVVRDATMLGVSAIAPFTSEHVSASSSAWQRGGAIERWRRVAVSSAKQCQRAVVPRVDAVRPLDQLLAEFADDTIIAAVEPSAEGVRPGSDPGLTPPAPTALALVGPEGGWSRSEIELLTGRGAQLIQLGPRTLRAETAPTVLLTMLWTAWGW